MSYSDWTIYKEGVGYISDSEVSSGALEGGFSLKVQVNGTDKQARYGRTSGMNITSGRIRSQFKQLTTPTGDLYRFLFAMQQTAVHKNNAAYLLVYDGTNLSLIKGTNLADPSPLASAAVSITVTSLYTLQLRWQRDAGTGHVFLQGYHGVADDYTDLAAVLAATDSASPYSSGVSAGFGFAAGASLSGSFDNLVDVTEGYRV